MDKVYAQIWYLVKDKDFVFELTREEIAENDRINKRFQVSTPESDLVDRFFTPSVEEKTNVFYNATEILEYIMTKTSIKLAPEKVGKALRFLDFNRSAKRVNGKLKHGYFVKINLESSEK